MMTELNWLERALRQQCLAREALMKATNAYRARLGEATTMTHMHFDVPQAMHEVELRMQLMETYLLEIISKGSWE